MAGLEEDDKVSRKSMGWRLRGESGELTFLLNGIFHALLNLRHQRA